MTIMETGPGVAKFKSKYSDPEGTLSLVEDNFDGSDVTVLEITPETFRHPLHTPRDVGHQAISVTLAEAPSSATANTAGMRESEYPTPSKNPSSWFTRPARNESSQPIPPATLMLQAAEMLQRLGDPHVPVETSPAGPNRTPEEFTSLLERVINGLRRLDESPAPPPIDLVLEEQRRQQSVDVPLGNPKDDSSETRHPDEVLMTTVYDTMEKFRRPSDSSITLEAPNEQDCPLFPDGTPASLGNIRATETTPLYDLIKAEETRQAQDSETISGRSVHRIRRIGHTLLQMTRHMLPLSRRHARGHQGALTTLMGLSGPEPTRSLQEVVVTNTGLRLDQLPPTLDELSGRTGNPHPDDDALLHGVYAGKLKVL